MHVKSDGAAARRSPRHDDVSGIAELVFDWNGTIIDDLERALHATNVVLTRDALPHLDATSFRSVFRLPLPAFFEALDVRDTDAAERLWNEAMAKRTAELSPGAREVLTLCRERRIPVGVVSGATIEVVAADVASHGVAPLLTWIVGSVRDKAIELAEAKRRSAAERIAYVGDTVHDVEHARQAGVLAIAYAGGYTRRTDLRDARPHHVIDRISDLVPLLRP